MSKTFIGVVHRRSQEFVLGAWRRRDRDAEGVEGGRV